MVLKSKVVVESSDYLDFLSRDRSRLIVTTTVKRAESIWCPYIVVQTILIQPFVSKTGGSKITEHASVVTFI